MATIFQIYNTYIAGGVDNTSDLGNIALEWKDLWIDGLAYIDGFGQDLDFGDFDVHSVDGLYGIDDNVFIDMGASGRIIVQANGAGTPFATPDIDITGTTYFDDDAGFLLDKKILFGDADVYIFSNDDGYLDLNANVGIRFNGPITIGGDLTMGTYDITGSDVDLSLGTGDITTTGTITSGVINNDADKRYAYLMGV